MRDGCTKGAAGERDRGRDNGKGKEGNETGETERHLWVSLLVGYLEEVKGVPQGGLLQGQGDGQGELLRQAVRKHLAGTMQGKEKFRRCQLQPGKIAGSQKNG